jgi:hypothetical protein
MEKGCSMSPHSFEIIHEKVKTERNDAMMDSRLNVNSPSHVMARTQEPSLKFFLIILAIARK